MNLAKMASQVKVAHGKVVKSLAASLHHAKEAGAALAQVVANRPAKEFVAWVEAECGISESTAYNCIRIHKNWKDVENEENYVKALRALRQSRKPKEDVPEQPLTEWRKTLKERAEQFCVKANLDNLELFLESFGIKEQIKLAA